MTAKKLPEEPLADAQVAQTEDTGGKKYVKLTLQKEAAKFVGEVLEEANITLDDVMSRARPVVLQKKETWARITAGDPTLSPSVYRDALSEICAIGHVPKSENNSLRREANKLRQRMAPGKPVWGVNKL